MGEISSETINPLSTRISAAIFTTVLGALAIAGQPCALFPRWINFESLSVRWAGLAIGVLVAVGLAVLARTRLKGEAAAKTYIGAGACLMLGIVFRWMPLGMNGDGFSFVLPSMLILIPVSLGVLLYTDWTMPRLWMCCFLGFALWVALRMIPQFARADDVLPFAAYTLVPLAVAVAYRRGLLSNACIIGIAGAIWGFSCLHACRQILVLKQSPSGISGNPNWLSATLIGVVPWVAAGLVLLASRCGLKGKAGKTLVAAVPLALTAWILYHCHTRGLYLSLGVTMMLAVFYSIERPLRRMLFLISTGAALGVALTVVSMNYFDSIRSAYNQDVRAPLWFSCGRLILEEPIKGHQAGIPEQLLPDLLVDSDYHKRYVAAEWMEHPHNQLLYIAIYLGIPAALVWFILLVQVFRCPYAHPIPIRLAHFAAANMAIMGMADKALIKSPSNVWFLLMLGICWAPQIKNTTRKKEGEATASDVEETDSEVVEKGAETTSAPDAPGVPLPELSMQERHSINTRPFRLEHPLIWLTCCWATVLATLFISWFVGSDVLHSWYARRGDQLLGAGHAKQAYIYYDMALKYRPDHLPTAYKAATVALQKIQPEQREVIADSLHRLYSRNPNFAHINRLWGRYSGMIGSHARALKFFERDVELFPENIMSRQWYLRELLAAGKTSHLPDAESAVNNAYISRIRAASEFTRDEGLPYRWLNAFEEGKWEQATQQANSMVGMLRAHDYIDPLVPWAREKDWPKSYVGSQFTTQDAGYFQSVALREKLWENEWKKSKDPLAVVWWVFKNFEFDAKSRDWVMPHELYKTRKGSVLSGVTFICFMLHEYSLVYQHKNPSATFILMPVEDRLAKIRLGKSMFGDETVQFIPKEELRMMIPPIHRKRLSIMILPPEFLTRNQILEAVRQEYRSFRSYLTFARLPVIRVEETNQRFAEYNLAISTPTVYWTYAVEGFRKRLAPGPAQQKK